MKRTARICPALGIGLAAMLLAAGCDLMGFITGTMSRLEFQVDLEAVPSAAVAGRGDVGTAAITPTHAAVMGIGANNTFLEFFPLDQKPVHAYLPQDATYAIAIMGPDADGRIVNAGPVKIGSFDLEVLPIDEDGAQVIDLGILSGTVDGFISDISDEEITEALGYSTEVLRELGAIDGQILRLLNPDANADGEVDSLQGIEWGVFVSHWFELGAAAAQLDIPPGMTRADLMTLGEITMNFWTTEDFGRYFTEDQLDELVVDIPVTVYSVPLGAETSTLVPGFGGPAEAGSGYGPILDSGGSWGSGAFSQFSLRGDVDPDGPYIGDHVFHIGAARYYVDGMNFYQHGDGFDGVPFPVYELGADGDGFVTSVSWAWYWAEEGEVVPAPPEVVRLLISEFVIQFGHMPSHGAIEGINLERPDIWYEGGTLDGLRELDIDRNIYMLGFYTRDLYGNTIQNSCPESYLGPSE